jgi:hypothetical protein
MAHGGRDPDMPGLRVPKGMQIDFYADFDENMFFVNGLSVVARGQLGTPNESYTENDPIPNYVYSALDSDQLGWYLQLDRTELPAWFVGNDLPDQTALCTDFVGCDNAGANIGESQHICDGVLGAAQRSGENHVVILACRGNMADPNQQGTKALVGSDGRWDDSVVDEILEEANDFLSKDFAAQEQTWNSWPEGTKTWFMSHGGMKAWADAYGARQLLKNEGPQPFAVYYEKLTPEARAYLENDPEIQEALTMAGVQTMFGDS